MLGPCDESSGKTAGFHKIKWKLYVLEREVNRVKHVFLTYKHPIFLKPFASDWNDIYPCRT